MPVAKCNLQFYNWFGKVSLSTDHIASISCDPFSSMRILFALHWPLALALTLVWLVLAFGFKISSVAGLTTALLLPFGLFYVLGPSAVAWTGVPIALLLFWRHRSNIAQLLAGGERRIGR